jgi:hypothetical protein
MKLKKTPPSMIMSLCHAFFDLNSCGCGGCFICSLSIDSSIIPEIFTYPPRGIMPIPYSVSPHFFLKMAKGQSKKR